MAPGDLLATPADRRDAWAIVSYNLFRDALSRPWRGVRWRAWLMAAQWSQDADPPCGWPGDELPYDWSEWK